MPFALVIVMVNNTGFGAMVVFGLNAFVTAKGTIQPVKLVLVVLLLVVLPALFTVALFVIGPGHTAAVAVAVIVIAVLFAPAAMLVLLVHVTV